MFKHYFYLKGDNSCKKITNFVSETLPDMTGVRTQVGSWPDVLSEWQSRNLGRSKRSS